MIRLAAVLALIACLGCGCVADSSASPPSSPATRSSDPLPRPIGPPLRRDQVSNTGRVTGGMGSYSAHTTVTDAERSLPTGQHGRLLMIPAIGSVAVTCTHQPSASFTLTTWARGEGPPTVTHTSTVTHDTASLAGLAATYTLPKAETTHQILDQWQISDGGGEAFQFSSTITTLLTQSTTRCDVLGEATTVTTGAFNPYAP